MAAPMDTNKQRSAVRARQPHEQASGQVQMLKVGCNVGTLAAGSRHGTTEVPVLHRRMM